MLRPLPHPPYVHLQISSFLSPPTVALTTDTTPSSPSCTAIACAASHCQRRHVRSRPRRLEHIAGQHEHARPLKVSCLSPACLASCLSFLAVIKHSLTCSIFSTSYPSATLDPPSRPKQGNLVFDGALGGYPSAVANPHHSQVETHVFEIPTSIAPSHNADPATTLSQARSSSRQYHQHQSSTSTFFPPSQLSRLAYGHQYVTVHPAEVSPLESCPSNSPLSAYPEMSAGGIGPANHEGCDPGGYVCPPGEDIKGTIGLGIGMGLSMSSSSAMQTNWNSQRKISEQDLGDDADAEGEEVNLSDVEQSFGSLPAKSPLAPAKPGEGENDEPVNDTDESKFSEEDSSNDSDDSEFVPGSRQRRPCRPATVSSSYPSYNPEGRRLRTRSGTRYTPYPNDYTPEHIPDYMDHNFDEALHNSRSRRFSAPSDTHGDLDISADYLSFSTLAGSSTSASRRRPRPSSCLPVPVPVPNLTKKSRGRRVPTATSLEDLRSASSGAGRKRQSAGKGARMYLCEVEGCGKCFARGEHLKRHVRSIHTYEKRERYPWFSAYLF
jgi:hypothetical protein